MSLVNVLDCHSRRVHTGSVLILAWPKDWKIGPSLINARAAMVAVKPAFRTAFKKRRYQIPANRFYE